MINYLIGYLIGVLTVIGCLKIQENEKRRRSEVQDKE